MWVLFLLYPLEKLDFTHTCTAKWQRWYGFVVCTSYRLCLLVNWYLMWDFGWAHRYSTSLFSFDSLYAIAKPQLNSRIKPLMHVRGSIMYEKAAFYKLELA